MRWFLASVDGFWWMWLGFPTVIVRGLRVCDFGYLPPLLKLLNHGEMQSDLELASRFLLLLSLSLSFFFSFFQQFCCFYILGLLKYAISLQMRWWIWAFSFFYHNLLLDSKWLAIKDSKCKVSNTSLYQMLGCHPLTFVPNAWLCLVVIH